VKDAFFFYLFINFQCHVCHGIFAICMSCREASGVYERGPENINKSPRENFLK